MKATHGPVPASAIFDFTFGKMDFRKSMERKVYRNEETKQYEFVPDQYEEVHPDYNDLFRSATGEYPPPLSASLSLGMITTLPAKKRVMAIEKPLVELVLD